MKINTPVAGRLAGGLEYFRNSVRSFSTSAGRIDPEESRHMIQLTEIIDECPTDPGGMEYALPMGQWDMRKFHKGR
jgi:hypothetical protein